MASFAEGSAHFVLRRADPVCMARPCEWCLKNTCNGGGAHPLTHLVVGDQQLCVDEEIAWAIELAWEVGIPTSNSCQAWGEWMPEDVQPPWWRRIDTPHFDDAERLAQLLGLNDYDISPNPWGHSALRWLATNDPCDGSPKTDDHILLG